MPRTVTASEAKSAFGALADWAVETKDDIVIESHGKPKVVIVAYEEYKRLAALREQALREEALAELEAIRESVQSRLRDITEEEAEKTADRMTRRAVQRLIAEGKVRYDTKG
ncbi:MAG: type II toxin-antitoxin system Phd/YefM family antitoxin [Chloroflexi bacterium]|nr:type II toxin-antitoxin system Phd/YefM family antitoxin [Chloroflexota bacterium]